MDTSAFVEFKRKLTENCGKVIVGKDEAIEQVIICLIAGGHILLEDVPGTGKTMLLRAFAKSIPSVIKDHETNLYMRFTQKSINP